MRRIGTGCAAALLILLMTVPALAVGLPPESVPDASGRVRVSRGAGSGDGTLCLARFDADTGRFLGMDMDRSGGDLDLPLDGDALFRAFCLDGDGRPASLPASCLVVSTGGRTYAGGRTYGGGTYDSVVVTDAVRARAPAALEGMTIRGDLTILSPDGAEAVVLRDCAVGGQIRVLDAPDPGVRPPAFADGYPLFSAGETSVRMRFQLDGPCTVRYVLAPLDREDGSPAVPALDPASRPVDASRIWEIPEGGSSTVRDDQGQEVRGPDGLPVRLAPFYLSVPSWEAVARPAYADPRVLTGSVPVRSGYVTATVDGLSPRTDYFAYLAVEGTDGASPDLVQLYRFSTAWESAALTIRDLPSSDWPSDLWQDLGIPLDRRQIDLAFSVTPRHVSMAGASDCWDLLFWSDASCQFEMYRRSRDASAPADDPASYADDPWQRIGPSSGRGTGVGAVTVPADGTDRGRSLHFDLCGYRIGDPRTLLRGTDSALRDGRVYDYAVRFLQVGGLSDRDQWSGDLHARISIVEGTSEALASLAADLSPDRYGTFVSAGALIDIGSPESFQMTASFRSSIVPRSAAGRPVLVPGTDSVRMRIQLDRPGAVHYVIAPVDPDDGWPAVATADAAGRGVGWSRAAEIPEGGGSVLTDAAGDPVRGADGLPVPLSPFYVSLPSALDIVRPPYTGAEIRSGSVTVPTTEVVDVRVDGLTPGTRYFVYLVLRNRGQDFSYLAQLFRFETLDA